MSGYRVELQKVSSGFNGRTFWAQARAGAIPALDGDVPSVVVTAQPTLRTGSDVFFALSEWRSNDLGVTWDGPIEHSETLGRREKPDGTVIGVCDMTPGWHAATGKLLSTGHTVSYADDKHPIIARTRDASYSVYEPESRSWSSWTTLQLPDRPDFASAGAGSAQRIDLEDGTILLPIYYKEVSGNWHACNSAMVVRCGFDGKTLSYIEHGTELRLSEPRGYCEPSITRFRGRYFLTLRNDEKGYVTSGDDGLHFDEPRPWCFDDGTDLGNYNTQQHWVSHQDGLFLVYTRRGLNNDHVFRHRAPLLMAQVDPDRLVVLRDTEREVVPNRGARIGNFSVCHVGPEETWIVVAEWMQPVGCEEYGSDNTIWVSRIIWDRPNGYAVEG